ncbi:MAG: hypothetical protein WC666_04425, partial [Candidatus Paceibacterota bacterium]
MTTTKFHNPTQKQGNKVLQIALQHHLLVEEMQKLIGSGLVSDLFEAFKSNGAKISAKRDEIRHILELERIKSEAIVSATITAHMVDINFYTIAEGIVAGNYGNNVDLGPVIDMMPISDPIESKYCGKKKVFLVQFDKRMESDQVIKELDNLELQPAGLIELLAFGKDYPEFQLNSQVVALGFKFRTTCNYNALEDKRKFCLFNVEEIVV